MQECKVFFGRKYRRYLITTWKNIRLKGTLEGLKNYLKVV